ncbi:MAG TPA: EAL domain-containing protein [Solirubrobacteraceae bacterium]
MPREQDAFYRATLDSLDEQIAVLDATGTTIAANAALERFIDYNPDCELRAGVNYIEACEAAPAAQRGRAAIGVALREMLAGRADGFTSQYELRSDRGSIRWFGVRATHFLGDGPGRVVVQHYDNTEVVIAQRSWRLRSRLLDEIDAAIVGSDLAGRIEVWSRGAEQLYGWTAAEVIGRNANEVVVALEHSFTALRETSGECNLQRKDGSIFSGYLSSVVYHGVHGEPAGIISLAVDAGAEGEPRRAHDQLSVVTGNIGEALCTLDDAGRVSYMSAPAERVIGWSVGLLSGQTLHDAVHAHCLNGHSVAAEECPLVRAHRARETVRVEQDTFIRSDGSNVSVGYVLAPFQSAEGDGSVIVFSDITRMQAERQRIRIESERISHVHDLQEALSEQRFELYAQPILDLATGVTVSHELLLRMRERDGTMRLPGTFLLDAERSGFIRELDRWVIRQAAEIAAQGHRVELNLSALSLGDPGLYDALAGAITESGAVPGDIVIELTETALMQDEVMAAAFVERAQALGCEFALDDFGTGSGGFSYLKNLPVTFLKIDIGFVRDLRTNLASRHVVLAVVGLAGSFGYRTVAEGVEDDVTLKLVRDMGVDYAQGYGIGRPARLQDTLYKRSDQPSDGTAPQPR